MTLERIEEFEKQGYDMTEHRQKLQERERKPEERRRRLEEDAARISLDMLDKYKTSTGDANSEFVTETAAFNNKGKATDKNKDRIAASKLVYSIVVQAYSPLYDPDRTENGGAVLLYALDEVHRFDINWLKATAKRIMELKQSASVPADSLKFIETLRNDTSIFVYKMGAGIGGEAEAWCSTMFSAERNVFPLNYVPLTRILPILITVGEGHPKEDYSSGIQLIPPKFYIK